MSTTQDRDAGRGRSPAATVRRTGTADPGRRATAGTLPVRPRVGVPLAAGVLAGVGTAFVLSWQVAILLGWDVAAVAYLGWCWGRISRMGAAETAAQAVRDDPGRVAADLVLLSAAVASLLAIGLVIVKAGNSSGVTKALLIALVMASVLLSWGVVHTTYTLRYAGLYYTGPDGGVDFNNDQPPSYIDFAYLAFTVGMTFQVSDTALNTRAFRATALRHALLSYLFGAVILAATINLVAGLSR